MDYIRLSPDTVWDVLGDGKQIVAVVLDDTGKFKTGVYDLNDQFVNVAVEMIDQCNTVFFMKQEG